MGTVYQAYDRQRKEEVALKTLLRADPTAIYLFKREFRTLADIVHPNLVSLYELLYEEGHWFFTMELLDGVDFLTYVRAGVGRRPASVSTDDTATTAVELTHAVDRSPIAVEPALGPAQLERLRAALAQLAEGLTALHDSGYLHRDLKPSNVMVTVAQRLVILDFGLSSRLSGRREE
jgi:serine/threonine protein kinase